MTKKPLKLEWEQVAPHVLVVRMDAPILLDNTVTLEGQRYHYFRDGRQGQKTVYSYISAPPSLLNEQDVLAINACLDKEEGRHNRAVKSLLADALSRHFKDAAFHVYDLGCGDYPLAPYFLPGAAVSYHGVESDDRCLMRLEKAGVRASSWAQALAQGPAPDRPTVCAAVYALHFMVDPFLPAAIEKLIGQDGFFVGNFYMHPHEKRSGQERRRLSALLEDRGLASIVMKAAGDPNNEYWIIGRAGDEEVLSAYAASLKQAMRAAGTRAVRVRNSFGSDLTPRPGA